MGIKYSNAWLQQYMYIPPPFQKGLKNSSGRGWSQRWWALVKLNPLTVWWYLSYPLVKGSNVIVPCVAKEHNTMTPARP